MSVSYLHGGAGLNLSSPAEMAIFVGLNTTDVSATVGGSSFSGLFLHTAGGLALRSAIKITGSTAVSLFCLYSDGGMVTATGATNGMTVDTVKIKCLIDGNVYYLLATTTPA